MQETRVQSLIWEDPTCHGATKPVHHNCWTSALEPIESCCPRAHALQQEKPQQWEAHAVQWTAGPSLLQLEKAHTQQRKPSTAKINKIIYKKIKTNDYQGLVERGWWIGGIQRTCTAVKLSYMILCVCACVLSLQWCPTLCKPMDCNLPGSSFHRIFQPRVLQCVAMPSSRGSSWPRDWTHLSYVSCFGKQVLYH